MTTPPKLPAPIRVKVVLPAQTEIYAYRGGIRCKDGRWLFALFVVDRREGIYIVERLPMTPAEARPIFDGPITRLSGGCLERGMDGSVHYVAHDGDEVLFLPVAPVGTVE